MGKLDKIKEDVGYLKSLIIVMIATAFTIIGYIFTQAEMLSGAKIFISIVGLLVCIIAILILNEKIIRKIEEMEEL